MLLRALQSLRFITVQDSRDKFLSSNSTSRGITCTNSAARLNSSHRISKRGRSSFNPAVTVIRATIHQSRNQSVVLVSASTASALARSSTMAMVLLRSLAVLSICPRPVLAAYCNMCSTNGTRSEGFSLSSLR